jgi:hypothetical protein
MEMRVGGMRIRKGNTQGKNNRLNNMRVQRKEIRNCPG